MAIQRNMKDLQTFLTDPRDKVRDQAITILLGQSTDSSVQPVFTRLNIGHELLFMMRDRNQAIVHKTLLCLINLTSNQHFRDGLLKEFPFDRIMKLLATDYDFKDMLVAILVNLTQSPEGQKMFLKLGTPLHGLHPLRLIHQLHRAFDIQVNQVSYLRVPDVICNVAQLEEGRHLLVEAKRKILNKLVPFLNDIRYEPDEQDTEEKTDLPRLPRKSSHEFRRDIWNVVRNACFVANNRDYTNVFLDERIDLIRHIIMPLICAADELPQDVLENVPSEWRNLLDGEKERDESDEIRRLALECLHLLSAGQKQIGLRIHSYGVAGILLDYEDWEPETNLVQSSQRIRHVIANAVKMNSAASTKSATESGTGSHVHDDDCDHDEKEGGDEEDDDEALNNIQLVPGEFRHEFAAHATKKKVYKYEQADALFNFAMTGTVDGVSKDSENNND